MRESRSTSDLMACTSAIGSFSPTAATSSSSSSTLRPMADRGFLNLVGDVGGHLADRGEALGLHQLRAGALDGGDHALEGGGELANLVVGVDDAVGREIAARDRVGARGHRRERREDAARVERGHHPDEEREQRQADEELHAALLAAARRGGRGCPSPRRRAAAWPGAAARPRSRACRDRSRTRSAPSRSLTASAWESWAKRSGSFSSDASIAVASRRISSWKRRTRSASPVRPSLGGLADLREGERAGAAGRLDPLADVDRALARR